MKGKDIINKGGLFLENKEFIPLVVELVEQGHEVTIPLRGNSMRPFLSDYNDKAILVSLSRPLRIGDVVLADMQEGRYVLHRIIKMNGEMIQMQGDGNLHPDKVVSQCDIKAMAKGFIRNGSDRIDYADGFLFRCYSFLWMRMIPLRRWLLAGFRRWDELRGNPWYVR